MTFSFACKKFTNFSKTGEMKIARLALIGLRRFPNDRYKPP